MSSTLSSSGLQDIHADILIVGGDTEGCAAALSGTSLGLRVIMTEPTD
jgi:glycerol-3-phosphate dehydrogenase